MTKDKKTSCLEHLTRISELIVNKKREESVKVWRNFADWRSGGLDAAFDFSQKIYDELKNDSLKEIEFNENDLRNFVTSKMDGSYDTRDSKILGLYSGCLLRLLTERNKAEGRKTQFYVDGQGGNFDYLFSLAREVDELIVENFVGDYICNGVGGNQGKADLVIGKGIVGRHALAMAGCKGGKIGLLLGQNIEGNSALEYAGGEGGQLDLVLGRNIKGLEALWTVGCKKGKIGLLLAKEIEGGKTLDMIAARGGRIHLVWCDESVGSGSLQHAGAFNGKIGKFLYSNFNAAGCEHWNEDIEYIYTGLDLEKHKRITQEYRLDEMMSLVDFMEDNSSEEIVAKARKIHSIYDSIKHLVENGKTR